MKTVVVLAALVALALGAIVTPHSHHKLTTKPVDAVFIEKQKKILGLFENVNQVNHGAEYFKIGTEWSIEANVESYTNKAAVKEFLHLWKSGFIPKIKAFSVFYERMREEAISLFGLFYYAKDFDTFYKTAAWARIHLNSGQFLYAYYIAVLQRPDTQGIVLPAPYEVYPELFASLNSINLFKMVKQQEGLYFPERAFKDGVVKEDNKYVVYSNYSNAFVFNNAEQRLAYFTEDVGLNSYYYYFHAQLPFWWNGEKFGPFKNRRGEWYYFFYKQLLNRYYFERLTNGLGPVPEFSWFEPIPTGYYPLLQYKTYPFVQRPDYFIPKTEDRYESVLFLDGFEKSFLQFLESGRFKAYEEDIDFHDPKTLNFVGNFWQYNADLFHENFTKTYQRSYEATARHVLGAAPRPLDQYTFLPTALDFYQTSLRDPTFWQLYSRIFQYIVQFKNYLSPYTQEELTFTGVKVEDVKVDKLVTYFDMFEYNVTNAIYFSQEELNANPTSFFVRQPRLNHKPYTVTIDIMSEKEVDAIFKIFLGPKYDSKGYPIPLEKNWPKFYLLDYFSSKLVVGKNEIKRSCSKSPFFKEDSVPIGDTLEMLNEGKVPMYMSEQFDALPQRLMLPKGTKDGFPFQIYVFVYPYEGIPKEYELFKKLVFDTKPFSYPFDRPVHDSYSFIQPNMYFKDVSIYHAGELFPYVLNTPEYFGNPHNNEVPK